MLRPDYPIVTPRLLLRPFGLADVDAVHDIYSRPEVVRYLHEDVLSVDDARREVTRRARMSRIDRTSHHLRLAVVRDDTMELIGDVLLARISVRHSQGEIGFVLHPDHQGQGFAYEAAREMMRLGFTELGLRRIIGRCDARNTASARVLERLGMRQEALFRENEFVKGEWTDELLLAILVNEWAAREPEPAV
ncbi:GNAT family N-acetyltransferase [Streptoalloteichus hindustanus]|uniref:Protein N-acetyltransferase, RimJ/RimL family n=1 Tax=Streptoalloteichus hindustanus TaxID=2017 RepID=A0A1M4YNY8_STRHI|nr:GNAT family N-acetyltransferase [Streptoalloteichus hindustanus]SHF07106.1 Protein N-acetyltransferase, RimJ/RimL family [Streptoalloteichus hindustanus]